MKDIRDMEIPDMFLTQKEVVDMLRVSRATFYNMRKEGRFPNGFKISSRKIVWKESEVRNFLKNSMIRG